MLERAVDKLLAKWERENEDAEQAKRDAEPSASARAKRERDRAEMDRRMGIAPTTAPVRREGRSLILGVMTPEQARAHRAARANH